MANGINKEHSREVVKLWEKKVCEMNVETVGGEMGPSLGMEEGGRDEDAHRGVGWELTN